MSLSLADAKTKVDAILAKYAAVSTPTSVVAPSLTSGKMYEAWVLAIVLERLEVVEGFTVQLVGSSKVHLKSSPGPINRSYPRFELLQGGVPVFEVWTDVEFTTLSYAVSHSSGKPSPAHRHELDLVVVPVGIHGYPPHDQIAIGVECKNTPFSKAMARAALGVRRELSLLSGPMATPFSAWPASHVPANPPSVLLVYSTHPAVEDYNAAGSIFGVRFVEEPM
jgi:hypothetical protein